MTHGFTARYRMFAAAMLLMLIVPVIAACGSSAGGSTSSNGTGSTSTTGKKIKVGLVTDIGGLNDRGFNALSYKGLQDAEKQLGVQGDVKQSSSGDDYVPNLTDFASKNYNLVIAVGFLMQSAVGKVAQEFPNVHFAIIDGDPTDASGNNILQLSNVAAIHFKEQDAGALVGVIAGMEEKQGLDPKKSNTIGAVGGVSIPPVDHYIAGYQWAAKMEDPNVKFLLQYSNDFADSAKCKADANAEIGKGADIVFQVAGGCGLGVIQAADQAGVSSIGVDTDQKADGTSVIASAVKRVDTAAFDTIKAVQDGSFKGGTNTYDLKNGGVAYAPGNGTLPADIQAEVTKVEGEIKAGTLTPPATVSK